MLCYLTFTNSRDIRPRLRKVLEEEKIRVGVLESSVPPKRREEWVQKHSCGFDVLLTNAELVKTGLDLYDFPTIYFYQTGYNVFSLSQAARRSWRIGQTVPVRVFFAVYRKTMQDIAISLVAKKLEVALMVEGELPEGLADYASSGGSIMQELGKALIEGGDTRRQRRPGRTSGRRRSRRSSVSREKRTYSTRRRTADLPPGPRSRATSR